MGRKSYSHIGALGLLIFLCLADVAWGMSTKQTSVRQPAAESVWIMKPNNAQSCSLETEFTLRQGIQELKKSHIPVLEARKGNDGKMHIQLCGAIKGSTDAYLIPTSYLPQAIALGYRKIGE